MNGAHDLGGMHGFGAVDIERDEPVFHSDWERKAFALTLAAGFLGKWNIDMSRYARGKRGEIVLDHGVWVFPDTAGNGLGRKPQHCYTVRFTARELWGPDAPARDAVHIDLWDDHLDPA